jgi:hypothetical protein
MVEYLNDDGNNTQIYNGYVEAVTTLLGAISVSSVGFVKFDWLKFGNILVTIASIVSGVMLFLIGKTDNIWMGYVG